MLLIASAAIILLTIYFIVRGVDVRLVLFAAGLALATLALNPVMVFDVFLAEMANGKTIGPICSAMGYAFVLRVTGCDREMVRLLLAPFHRARWLLIPAGCVAGFITNTAITSQTAVAAVVGPILVPLMISVGFSPMVAAATLVLGCSGGGCLFNPGDAELVAIREASGAPMKDVLGAMISPLLGGFAIAVVVHTLLSRRSATPGPVPEPDPAPIQYWKALFVPLPVVIIFVGLPGLIFRSLPPPFEHGIPVSHAMLASTLVVLLCFRRDVSSTVKSFFEGMGYAYVHVISLIVTASCFIAGMTAVGLTDRLIQLVSGAGVAGKLATAGCAGFLAVLSGSGIGPSVAFAKAVLPGLRMTDLPLALDLGTIAAIAANFGRTMSPVAAVVIFSAALAEVPVSSIIKRTAPPLFVGGIVALAIILARAR